MDFFIFFKEPESSPQDLAVELRQPTTVLLTWNEPFKKPSAIIVRCLLILAPNPIG